MEEIKTLTKMNSHTEDKTTFFEAQLPPGELEHILSRIEENLAFRQILKKSAGISSSIETSLPPVPSINSLENQLQVLKALKAPLFRPEESQGAGVWFRRLLNLPLRLFGYKQSQFNTNLLTLIHEMTILFHQTLNAQHQALLAAQQELQRLAERQQQLEAKLSEQSQNSVELSRD